MNTQTLFQDPPAHACNITSREELLRTLLTHPAKVAALCAEDSLLRQRALPVVLIGTAIFGGAVGVFRGGCRFSGAP